MLGIYEKRSFAEGEKIWFGSYRNLTNVLHWHFECEIIRVVKGKAKIKIGESCFEATENDCFFCAGEELHYIISEHGTQVDIAILDESLAADITSKYMIASPKLPKQIPVKEYLDCIKKELSQKKPFYCEAIENDARRLLIAVFRSCQIAKCPKKASLHKQLIDKINRDFSSITFQDAVHDSGYSPSHFSKMFKKLSGMSFSQYLNIIKVENAILLLQAHSSIAMTTVCEKCGFSTVRNFNRVFKKITGYSPSALPRDFIIHAGLPVSKTDRFDPTGKASILIQ